MTRSPMDSVGQTLTAASMETKSATLFEFGLSAWENHESELRGYLSHRLRDISDAEDLLQDTFLKTMCQGNAFCCLNNLRAWPSCSPPKTSRRRRIESGQ